MENYNYIIYTDGAYSMKNDEGAFAFVILNGNMEEIMRRAFKIKHETNNRAELKAIIGALYQITTWNRKVLVVSDSQYSIKTLSGEWGRKANEDLFEIYDQLIEEREMHVDYKWVRGHNGDKYNEICDEMCVKALGYDPKEEYEKYAQYKKSRRVAKH